MIKDPGANKARVLQEGRGGVKIGFFTSGFGSVSLARTLALSHTAGYIVIGPVLP